MKKRCELCNRNATSYCESDEAWLCWACDAAVHDANFLTAKHLRVVLCRVCQDPTRWIGSGVLLDPTARACPACTIHHHHEDDDVVSDGSCTDESVGDTDCDDDQVVPTPTSNHITTPK